METIKLTAKQVNGEWVALNADSEINEGDYQYNHFPLDELITKSSIQHKGTLSDKVIASTHLDTPYKLDKVHIEKMLRGFSVAEYISERFSNYDEKYKEAAIKGFLLSEQMNKRKFDEDDIRKAIQFGLNGMYGYKIGKEGETEYQINQFTQSLQNPTYTIEVEAEEVIAGDKAGAAEIWINLKPKQTKGFLNVIKITKQ